MYVCLFSWILQVVGFFCANSTLGQPFWAQQYQETPPSVASSSNSANFTRQEWLLEGDSKYA